MRIIDVPAVNKRLLREDCQSRVRTRPGKRKITTREGYHAARTATINTLAQMNKAVGIDMIDGLNHIDVFCQSVAGWDEARDHQP